jgi:hypothetical protein
MHIKESMSRRPLHHSLMRPQLLMEEMKLTYEGYLCLYNFEQENDTRHENFNLEIKMLDWIR